MWWPWPNRTPQPGKRQPRSRRWGARRSAGGIVRVRASTSTTRPSWPCRITTRLASHARRCDVPAGTRAVLEDRLTGLIGVGEDFGVDVDHHLVSLCRCAGIDTVVEGGLREQGQRIRLLLGHRRRVRRNVYRAGARVLSVRLLIQGLAG